MNEIPLARIILCSTLVAFGLITHFVSKLAELEARGVPVSPWEYICAHKFTTLNVVLGAYGLLLLAYYTGEMGPMGAFCMGVAANAAGDKLRARAQAKIDSQPNDTPGT
jgi:hypothetical protein